MGIIRDRIERGLEREIANVENSDMSPEEQRREIADLERQARWDYAEERARHEAEEDW